MQSLIHATQLERRYGSHLAVAGLDIELCRGDILGFLGPNGAGKSTSMRMLTGNLAPHGGRVLIDGIDLLEQPLQAKRNLGYLPETPPLYREMTVDEYLAFAARINAIPKAACAAAVERAKQRCGLRDVGRRLIGNLSKGYQQRVGIAQAIIHDPLVVVLDEPTVGLDPNQIREIRALIRELGEAHSVILSTHILPEVQSLCNRVQIIHQGRTLYSDRLSQAQTAVEGLRIRLRQDPPEGQLLTLAGVRTAQRLPDGHWQLGLEATADIAELAAQLVARGWGLLALEPQRRSLEQIFVQLTTGEAA
ncbi:ATP-binding cassette domain-containing protein [Magnetovirga frankeli]|uniref:ATP-binding cassette domain-containing protein n=1 Tax=Magnetovirga frankeli TaxID=947516 RepID=UPI00129305C1|nr:ATP-binding cassette domain-containing protein [gamma proteobacterium SS-5]